eukprot:s1875_g3.t1
MVILCALTVARATAAALQEQCCTREDREKITDALENLKEVLASIHVNEAYADHVSMTKFCDRVLWSTRGLLLQWEVTSTSLQELPATKMPALEKNPVWKITHPNRELFLSEVTAGHDFLLLQQNILKGRDMVAAMARFSENSIAQIKSCLSGNAGSQHRSGALKRKLSEALGPYRACYKEVAVCAKEATRKDIVFYMADVRRLLSLYACECPSFAALLQKQAARKFETFLAHDEATAGNVLNPMQRMKTLLVYFTLTPLSPYFDTARAWMPLAAITHEQMQQCPGGMSAITACIVEEWLNQNLSQDFVVSPDMPPMSLALSGFISDMESQRGAYAAKGSAALKPCMHCGNCLMKNALGAENSDCFFTIEEPDLSRFTANDPDEIERYIVHWINEIPNMNKAELDLRQKCLGFQLDPNSIWAYPRARKACHIGIAINDAMHSYWANGICNSEIALVLTAVEKHTKMDVSHLCEAMVAAGWKRHKAIENQWWCKRLWTPALFSDYEYKGSATQCHALMALVRWYCETVWLQIPCLRGVAECFLALARCTDALSKGKKTKDWSDLDKAQSEHQKLFARVHPNLMRPKHHHRLHLSRHYLRHGVCISAWGIEQCHQHYKKIYADNLRQLLRSDDGKMYSQHLMPRLLLRQVQMCREHPFEQEDFTLVSPFTQAEVEASTGMKGVTISRTCRLRLADISENSIILWGQNYEEAAVCRFFLKREDGHFVYFTPLQLINRGESYRCFRMLDATDIMPMDALQNLHIPAFTSAESAKLICLP